MSTKLDAVLSRVCRTHCWIKTPDRGMLHIKEPLDDFKVAAHLNKLKAYGACPIHPGTSTTRLALFDLDSHKGETPWDEMLAIARELKQCAGLIGLRATAVRSSGGKGIHLFFLWDSDQDAYSVRAALQNILTQCSYKMGAGGLVKKEVEIFPKQNSVPADGCGNMFVLPFAGQSELRTAETEAWAVSDDVAFIPNPRRKNGNEIPEELRVQSVHEGGDTAGSAAGGASGSGDAGQASGTVRRDEGAAGTTGGSGGVRDGAGAERAEGRGAGDSVQRSGSDALREGAGGTTVHSVAAAEGLGQGAGSELQHAVHSSAGAEGRGGVLGSPVRATAEFPSNDAERQTLRFLETALAVIPDGHALIEDRNTWRDCIFGIHEGTRGSDCGRSLAHRFSARSKTKYDADAVDAVWDSAGSREGDHVTERSIYFHARQYGWRQDVIEDFARIEPEQLGPSEQPVGNTADDRSGGIRFQLHTLSQLGLRPAPTWRVKDYLPDTGLGFIFGDSTSGKTFFAIDLACAIARGIAWLGLTVKPGRVVYLAAEGAAGFARRIDAYRKHHGLEQDQLSELRVITDAPNLMNVDDALAIARVILEWGKVAVIFVDTLSVVTPGANENAGEEMSTLMLHCKKIAQATGSIVVLIHHTGKDSGRGARGWSGFRHWADMMTEITRVGDQRTIRFDKVKEGSTQDQLYGFRLQQIMLDMDEEGDMITSCVVVPSDAPVSQSRAKGKAADREMSDRILATIVEMKGLGANPDPRGVPHDPLVDAVREKMVAPVAPGPGLKKPKDRRAEYIGLGIQRLINNNELVQTDGFLQIVAS